MLRTQLNSMFVNHKGRAYTTDKGYIYVVDKEEEYNSFISHVLELHDNPGNQNLRCEQ